MKSFKALSAMLCMPGQCISCFDHARIYYCRVQEAESELAADDALVNVEVLKVREPDWTSTIVHPEGKFQLTRFCLFSSRRFNNWMSWEDHAMRKNRISSGSCLYEPDSLRHLLLWTIGHSSTSIMLHLIDACKIWPVTGLPSLS